MFVTSSCYTVLENSKNDISANNSSNLGDSVFLPSDDYMINNFKIIDLCQDWVNSRESDKSIVWRPGTYKSYPPSRFREKIIFSKNGTYKELILSPNDAHYFAEYRWRLSKNKPSRILIFNSDGKVIKSMTISKLDSFSLEFKK